MIKNFAEPERKTEIEYNLVYDDGRGNGFWFPCDADGNLFEMSPDAHRNLRRCQEHPEKFVRAGKVERTEFNYRLPARGTCSCGETVYLIDEYCGACECPKCGQWYNLFGQELLKPKFWQEAIDYDY